MAVGIWKSLLEFGRMLCMVANDVLMEEAGSSVAQSLFSLCQRMTLHPVLDLAALGWCPTVLRLSRWGLVLLSFRLAFVSPGCCVCRRDALGVWFVLAVRLFVGLLWSIDLGSCCRGAGGCSAPLYCPASPVFDVLLLVVLGMGFVWGGCGLCIFYGYSFCSLGGFAWLLQGFPAGFAVLHLCNTFRVALLIYHCFSKK